MMAENKTEVEWQFGTSCVAVVLLNLKDQDSLVTS